MTEHQTSWLLRACLARGYTGRDAEAGCVKSLPQSNGTVGIIGTCSGGWHAHSAACRTNVFDAVADLWDGRVVTGEADLAAAQPVAPIDYTRDLAIPIVRSLRRR